MTKQEKIQEAYIAAGVDWEAVKEYVDEDGWCKWVIKTPKDMVRNFLDNKDLYDKSSKNEPMAFKTFVRPKSLRGIEDNAGWINMEGEDVNILPTEKGDYFGLYPDGTISCFFFNPEDDFDRELFLTELTHYQPIVKPSLPLY